jgi:hypothetical protein
MTDRWTSFLTHWDLHVLIMTVFCAVAGSAAVGSARVPLRISLCCFVAVMSIPEAMMVFGGVNARGEPHRRTKYLISNQVAVLLIATCVFTARRLWFA